MQIIHYLYLSSYHRLGYIDVIHFLIVNHHVDPTQSDSHRRSLIFSAVMYQQASVVKYLITRVISHFCVKNLGSIIHSYMEVI